MTADELPDYNRLKEGLCPVCGVLLERMATHGRCPGGHGRWSLDTSPDGTTVNVYFEVDLPDVFHRESGEHG